MRAAPAGGALAGLTPDAVKPIKPSPAEAIGRVISKPAPAPVQFKSIPEQIDEILQHRLRGTPLEGRGIVLMLDPVEGVVVKVGYDRYPVWMRCQMRCAQRHQAAVAEWSGGRSESWG
jgi:hypothetical protein